MKKYMPLEGLRWSRDSGSTLCDTPQNGRSRTGWGGLLKEKNREKKPDCRVRRSAIKNFNKTSETVTKDYDSINNFKMAKKREKKMKTT